MYKALSGMLIAALASTLLVTATATTASAAFGPNGSPGDPDYRSGAIISNTGCLENAVRPWDVGNTVIDLGFDVRLNRKVYDKVWVNPYGTVSFAEQNWSPSGSEGDLVWADEIILGLATANSTLEFDDAALSATPLLYGMTTWQGRDALCATWLNQTIPFEQQHGEPYFEVYDEETGWGNWKVDWEDAPQNDSINSFQVLLVDRSDVSPGAVDIVLNYDTVQWQGYESQLLSISHSADDPDYRFVYEKPEAGYAGGVGVDNCNHFTCWSGYVDGFADYDQFPLPEAPKYLFDQGEDHQAFLDTSPTGLAVTSTGSSQVGRHIFHVRQPIPVEGPIYHVGSDGYIYVYDFETGDLIEKLDPPAGAGTYAALGDSYHSGEGTFLYSWQTDVNGTNQCHRSETAAPYLLWNEGFFGDLSLEFWACSGAVADDMFTGGIKTDTRPWDDPARPEYWSDENLAGYDPGAVRSELDRLDENTRVVTISIGGNDLGFVDILSDCIYNRLGAQYFAQSCDGWRDAELRDALTELETNQLPGVYRSITRRAPNAEIYVFGYPRFFPINGGKDVTSVLFQDRCNHLITGEQKWINTRTAEANAAIERVTDQFARVHFFDIYDVGDGDEICTPGDDFMNGLVFSGTSDTPESFHPNDTGHAAIAELFKQAYPDLTADVQRILFGPGDTDNRSIDVVDKSAFTVEAAWYQRRDDLLVGSGAGLRLETLEGDISIILTSPSGRVITKDTVAGDVTVVDEAQLARIEVTDPEDGEWQVQFVGSHLIAEGIEAAVNVALVDAPPVYPTATVGSSQAGHTVTVSAADSTPGSSAITGYEWTFSDGTVTQGVDVEHTFGIGHGDGTVTLAVTDENGLTDFETVIFTMPDYAESRNGDPVEITGPLGYFAPPSRAWAGTPVVLGFDLGQDWGDDVLVAGSPSVQRVKCSTGEAIGEATSAENAWGFDPTYSRLLKRYVWAWETERSWANTCQQVTLDFNDGSSASHTVKFFRSAWNAWWIPPYSSGTTNHHHRR